MEHLCLLLASLHQVATWLAYACVQRSALDVVRIGRIVAPTAGQMTMVVNTSFEGGEQGDPLMPGVYLLAQHAPLQSLTADVGSGEAVFAFLDDLYIVAALGRGRALHDALSAALWQDARVHPNHGKARICRRKGAGWHRGPSRRCWPGLEGGVVVVAAGA